MSEHPELGFEEALTQLEDRVRALESANVPLDKALTLFEEGVSLARSCHEHLEAAQKRVAALSHGSAGVAESAFDEV